MAFHEVYDNVLELADWLDNTCDYFADTRAMLRYFERPCKYSKEWDLFQLWAEQCCNDPSLEGYAKRVDSAIEESIVEALSDSSLDAEHLTYGVSLNFHVRRRYVGTSQPDTWEWVHEDYDGPEDGRCGVGRSLREVLYDIDEIDDGS
jgi:hypothetical protein